MNLIKKFSWIFAANAFSALIKWFLIILIARNLSAVSVGVYSLAFALSAPITLLANMKLRSLYITEKEEDFKEYLLTRNITSILTFGILLIMALVFYEEYLFIILLVGLTKLLDLQSDLFYAVPHKKNELDIIGKMIFGKHLTILASFSITIFYFKNLELALIAQVFTQLIFLLVVERGLNSKDYKIPKKNVDYKKLKTIFMLGLPLGFVQMLYSFNTNSIRYVLEYFESTEILGYFGAIIYLTTIFNLLMNSVSQIFLPKLSYLIKAKKIKLFERYIYIYLTSFSFVAGIVLVTLATFLGDEILIKLYGEEYASFKNILILVSISVAVNMISWNFDTALMAMRYISIQLPITIFNLIISIFLGVYLISKYGIEGAAYTLIFNAVSMLCLRLFFVFMKGRALKK